MKRLTLLTVILLLVVVLAACGGEESDVSLKAVESSADTEVELSANAAAMTENFDGALMFIQGESFYYFDPASGETPQFLTNEIDPITINFAPDGDRMMYESGNLGDGYAHLLNLHTLETLDIPTIINSRASTAWFVLSWSPDGQWAVTWIREFGIEAVRLDGSDGFQLARTGDAFHAWLSDGNILVVDRNFHPSQIVYRGVYVYDVNTGEPVEWDMNEEALVNDFPSAVEAMVAEHGLELAYPLFGDGGIDIIPPDNVVSFTNTADVCAPWSLARPVENPFVETPDTERDILYQAENVHRLTDPVTLEDGSLLFLEWTLPNCRISEMPQITLKHLVVGGAPTVIAEGVSAEISYSLRTRFQFFTGRYTLSPDQRYVAWVGGSYEAGVTTLNITDMTTSETVTLLTEERGNLNDLAFNTNQLFRRVYWVNS